mgnify:FL=1
MKNNVVDIEKLETDLLNRPLRVGSPDPLFRNSEWVYTKPLGYTDDIRFIGNAFGKTDKQCAIFAQVFGLTFDGDCEACYYWAWVDSEEDDPDFDECRVFLLRNFALFFENGWLEDEVGRQITVDDCYPLHFNVESKRNGALCTAHLY